MQTQCLKCEKTQEIPDAYRGREIKCLHCKEPFVAKEWVKPDEIVTQCPACMQKQYTWKTNVGKDIACGQCGREFRADFYVSPPAAAPVPKPEEPYLCGVLTGLAWLIGGLSALALIPTMGASIAGIIFALLLGWAAQMLKYSAKK